MCQWTAQGSGQELWCGCETFTSAVQGAASGRLLSYNPKTGKTHVVAQGFWFANGVALSRDESFIAVVETNTQTVHRVWLAGAKVRPKLLCGLLEQFLKTGVQCSWL